MRDRGAANIQLSSSSDLTSLCSASITSDLISARPIQSVSHSDSLRHSPARASGLHEGERRITSHGLVLAVERVDGIGDVFGGRDGSPTRRRDGRPRRGAHRAGSSRIRPIRLGEPVLPPADLGRETGSRRQKLGLLGPPTLHSVGPTLAILLG